jgi:hypothetical protein
MSQLKKEINREKVYHFDPLRPHATPQAIRMDSTAWKDPKEGSPAWYCGGLKMIFISESSISASDTEETMRGTTLVRSVEPREVHRMDSVI